MTIADRLQIIVTPGELSVPVPSVFGRVNNGLLPTRERVDGFVLRRGRFIVLFDGELFIDNSAVLDFRYVNGVSAGLKPKKQTTYE